MFSIVRPTDDTVGTEVNQLHLEVRVGVGPVDRELELVGVSRIQSRRWLDRKLGHVGVLLDGVARQIQIDHRAVDRVTCPPVGDRIDTEGITQESDDPS